MRDGSVTEGGDITVPRYVVSQPCAGASCLCNGLMVSLSLHQDRLATEKKKKTQGPLSGVPTLGMLRMVGRCAKIPKSKHAKPSRPKPKSGLCLMRALSSGKSNVGFLSSRPIGFKHDDASEDPKQ